MVATTSPNSPAEAPPATWTTDSGSDADPLLNPRLLNQRVERPDVIASESRKVIAYMEEDDWSEAEVKEGLAYFLEEVGRGGTPREAFRKVCVRRKKSLPWIPKGRLNILARRLGISRGTHNLIARLSAEYGDSYTSFVRSIVETWAEEHRLRLVERPEMDMGYDPEWESAP